MSNSTRKYCILKFMAAVLNGPQRAYVIKYLTLGSTQPQIQDGFKNEFGRAISAFTISRIKKLNQVVISEAQDTIAKEAVASALAIKQAGYELAENEVQMALEDMKAIRELRRKLQSEEITPHEYKRKRELYERITINELSRLTDSMHSQTKGDGKDDPISPHDQAALAALIAGIQSGNPTQLIQVLTTAEAENREA